MLRSETLTSVDRRAAALAGLAAYQAAERQPPPDPAPILAEAGRATIRDFGGAGPAVLFVPSLINPPRILDLAPGNSLLRWLAEQGVRPLLLDWGTPLPDERDISVAGHVERYLLPLIDRIDRPVTLAGYCLGGTMALAAAALRPVEGLVLIAAPWTFRGFPPEARDAMAALGASAAPPCEQLGLMPIELLQTAFWRLDPARSIAKFERFGRLDPASAAARSFVALEDWASDGPPLTLAAGMEMIDAFFTDDLPGKGQWRVGGQAIDPAAIRCPVLDVVSTTDRIVPAATAAGIGERRTLALGHVGMIVGGRARTALWEPLADWLSRLPRT